MVLTATPLDGTTYSWLVILDRLELTVPSWMH
jgi:hypothetical protein